MPTLRNSQGQEFEVSDVDAVNMSKADPSLSIVGDVRVSPDEANKAPVSMRGGVVATQAGHAPATAGEEGAYAHAEYLKDKTSSLGAAARGLGSGLSFGLTDYLADPETIEADELHHSGLRTGASLVGAIAPAFAGDLAGLAGLGKGAAVADDALSAERAASSLSSRALFGDGKGASALEKGLARTNAALGEGAEAARAADSAVGLEGLDKAGLKAERETELGRIETERVGQRSDLADDIAAHRQATKDDALFLTTKGLKEDGLNVLGKRTLKADQALDRLLDNPKAFATRPQRALEALQQQESAYEGILAKSDKLKATFAADTSGERMAALDKVPQALERNRALQGRIANLVAEPASVRLKAIGDAEDVLASGGRPQSIAEKMLGGAAYSGVAGFVGALPGVGHMLAPLAGAKASQLVTDLVFGKAAGAIAEHAAQTADTVKAFMAKAAKSPAIATVPVLATKVLRDVSFGAQPKQATPRDTKPAKETLASLYKARSDEIKQQTAYDATGATVMRPEARQAMGARLAGLRAIAPILADKIETTAARRIEYLSSQLPRRPDTGAVQIGPDRWQPSDLEMRAFARKVAAAEDPAGVEKRLVDGTLSPEDVEAYHAVYPERAEHLKQQIMEQLPMLQHSLPYARRLALSMFSGVPVDPSMHPAVLAVLQGHFANEDGSEGGTQAPKPQPAFGSVRADIGTASQQREGAMR